MSSRGNEGVSLLTIKFHKKVAKVWRKTTLGNDSSSKTSLLKAHFARNVLGCVIFFTVL
jgi:hypothetical protein